MLQTFEDQDYPLDLLIVGLAQLLTTGMKVNDIDPYTLGKLKAAVTTQLDLIEAKIH
jgi:hypothetical protein